MSELRTHERPQRATRTWEPDLGWRWGEAAGALGERASGYDPRTTGGGKAPEIDTGRLKAAARAREARRRSARRGPPRLGRSRRRIPTT